MPRIEFDALPESARLWVFAAARQLEPAEVERVLDATDAFLEQWAAHGVPLAAGREVRHGQFLFVAVDEARAGVSGCSIDALVRQFRSLESELGVPLVDNAPVLYRNGESIARVSRSDFAELVSEGAVGLETTVFDNTVGKLGDLRAGKWEVPASDSWHAAAFF